MQPAPPASLQEFTEAISGQLPEAELVTPLRRRRQPARISNQPPRRSIRLAKKSKNRTLALAAAQNVLMRKLGLTTEGPPENEDFCKYIQVFREGLTEQQVQLIQELFYAYVPTAEYQAGEDGQDS